MSQKTQARLVEISNKVYQGILTTNTGNKLETPTGTKGEALTYLTSLDAYKEHPVHINLQ